MKAIRIKGVTAQFKPITIAITLETQEEVDALKSASDSLEWPHIDCMHSVDDRSVWCKVLDCIGEEV